MRSFSKIVLGVGGLLLLIGVAVSIWAGLQRRKELPWVLLASRLPMTIAGWQGEDLPLGETEAVRHEVGKLNYNDYIYRVYRKNGEEVYVYAMFWRQGDISVREIAGHTPDGCWVANGTHYGVDPEERMLRVGSRKTKVAQIRRFYFVKERMIQVVWWHLWGGRLVDQELSHKSVAAMLRETWTWFGKNGGAPRDQLFVRVHTMGSLNQALSNPAVESFLNQLPEVWD